MSFLCAEYIFRRGYHTIYWLLLFLQTSFPRGSVVKNPPANAGDPGDTGSILGQENPLEKEIATHSSIFAWKIPWKEEPGGLQSMGS